MTTIQPFTETQRFTQPWLWAIILLVPFPLLFIPEVTEGKSMSEIIAIVLLVMLPGPLIFMVLKLKTEINAQGIYFQFIPFHFSKKKITWEEIDQAFLREYKPIREYGGWGIRFGFKNGMAYNVKGNTGLQLVLKNGKNILIGTQKKDEIEKLLVFYFKPS